MPTPTLTSKQKSFVDHYVTCRNGAEAARRAGYSEKTARQIATENLSKPAIQAAIAAKQAEIALILEIDRDVVVGGILGGIATARTRGDGGNMIRGYGELARLLGLDRPEARSVALSAESSRLQAQLEALSDAQLMAIIEG